MPHAAQNIPEFFRLDSLNLEGAWFILARSGQVTRQPSRWMLLNQPLVLFRDARGQARALLDRCPHRGVRLSLGRVVGSGIVCRYHGRCFAGDGQCLSTPSDGPGEAKAGRDVPSFETFESRGFVWVGPRQATAAAVFPQPPLQAYFTDLDEPRKGRIVHGGVPLQAFFISALENRWEAAHRRFSRPGGGHGPVPAKAQVSPSRDGSEVVHATGPLPRGALFAALRLMGCRTMARRDLFHRPGYVESLYEFGDGHYIRVQDFVTPNSDTDCTCFSVTTFHLPLPHGLLLLLGGLRAGRIAPQDRGLLESQRALALQAGEPRIAFARSDFLLPELLRILRKPAAQPPLANVTLFV